MEFNFTPKAVKEIEVAKKLSIAEIVSDNTIDNVLFLIAKGKQISEDQADLELTQYLDDGGEMHVLLVEIMKALQKRGFLPRKLNLSLLVDQMERAMDKALVDTEALLNPVENPSA